MTVDPGLASVLVALIITLGPTFILLFKRIRQVHVLVNNQLKVVMDRVNQLESVLKDLGIEVPPSPISTPPPSPSSPPSKPVH